MQVKSQTKLLQQKIDKKHSYCLTHILSNISRAWPRGLHGSTVKTKKTKPLIQRFKNNTSSRYYTSTNLKETDRLLHTPHEHQQAVAEQIEHHNQETRTELEAMNMQNLLALLERQRQRSTPGATNLRTEKQIARGIGRKQKASGEQVSAGKSRSGKTSRKQNPAAKIGDLNGDRRLTAGIGIERETLADALLASGRHRASGTATRVWAQLRGTEAREPADLCGDRKMNRWRAARRADRRNLTAGLEIEPTWRENNSASRKQGTRVVRCRTPEAGNQISAGVSRLSARSRSGTRDRAAKQILLGIKKTKADKKNWFFHCNLNKIYNRSM
jgi:hypothetical protein